jgi:hypothetical protein
LRPTFDFQPSTFVAPLAAVFMAPGVNDKEEKDKDAQDEEHDRGWLSLPKRMKFLREFIQTHAPLIYTSIRERGNSVVKRDGAAKDIPVWGGARGCQRSRVAAWWRLGFAADKRIRAN